MALSSKGRTSDVGLAIGLSRIYPMRKSFKARLRGGGAFQDQALRSYPSGPPSTLRAASRSGALRAIGPATARPVENPLGLAAPPGAWPLRLTRSKVGL